VRVTRRIITEVQTVEVRLRREELVVVREPLAADDRAVLPGGRAPVAPPAEVIVLHREVPHVTADVEPYEQVTVSVEEVTDDTAMQVPLRAKRVELVASPSGGPVAALA